MRKSPPTEAARRLFAQVRSQHPRFIEAVVADARIAVAYRGEAREVTGTLDGLMEAARLALVSDAFLGLALYRAKARLQALGVPVLPHVCHRLAMIVAQVCIGDPVIVRPGIYLAHGQVVIDGVSEVESGAVFFPWVTVGLKAGNFDGPTIGRNVRVGTGAKIIGPVRIGAGASIGANAVVVDDVEPETTVAGVPARALVSRGQDR
jgi:serine O-acetyltransferase